MKCEKCGDEVRGNIIYEFKEKKICDDCYIDLLIGTPDVDISKLPPEMQADLQKVMKNWHRDRPNRHHYYKLPKIEES